MATNRYTKSQPTDRQKAIHARDVARWRIKHNLRQRLWRVLSGPNGATARREVERALDRVEGTQRRAAKG